jgi:hypothetical protein
VVTFDSVINQNSIELIAVNILNAGLFGYSYIQFIQAESLFSEINNLFRDSTLSSSPTTFIISPFHIPAIVVSGVFFIGTLALSFKLHRQYGWAIYKRIGADIGLRRQMMFYFFLMMLYVLFILQRFRVRNVVCNFILSNPLMCGFLIPSRLKIDVFFYFTFSLQFLVIGSSSKSDTSDLAIHVVVSLAMIFLLLFLCIRGIRTENEHLMYGFMLGTVGCMAYLSYKMYQVNKEYVVVHSIP